MRVRKEAGVLLISGLPKLTPFLCLLSWQSCQYIAMTLNRGQGPCSRYLQVRREPRAGLGAAPVAELSLPSPALLCPHLGRQAGIYSPKVSHGLFHKDGQEIRAKEQRT